MGDLIITTCNRLNGVEIDSLAAFFATLNESNASRYFHPHPFTSEEATKRATYKGNDLYYVILCGIEVVGYGMLRGWDEGYTIPSMGIAIRADYRGDELGGLLMSFLHHAARQKGAGQVRVKVYPENVASKRMVEKMGYQFTSQSEGQLVGYITL